MALRQRMWIDHSVQGSLIGRVVIYWVFGLIYLGLGSACFQYYQHPTWSVSKHLGSFASQCGPWLPFLILIVPLVIFDVVRLSNQFAGPVFRLRRQLRNLVSDPDCAPLTFREDDYWRDLAEPVNSLQQQIIGMREQLKELHAARSAAERIAVQRGSETPTEEQLRHAELGEQTDIETTPAEINAGLVTH